MKNMASLPKMREWWAMTDEMQVWRFDENAEIQTLIRITRY
jgi:L-rhamnose mutarotase